MNNIIYYIKYIYIVYNISQSALEIFPHGSFVAHQGHGSRGEARCLGRTFGCSVAGRLSHAIRSIHKHQKQSLIT